MPKDCVKRIADEIHGEDANREVASPFGAARETESRQSTSGADRSHERDGPRAELLKFDARIGAQLPDCLENTARKREREHDGAADQRSGCKKNDEENDASRPAISVHAETR